MPALCLSIYRYGIFTKFVGIFRSFANYWVGWVALFSSSSVRLRIVSSIKISGNVSSINRQAHKSTKWSSSVGSLIVFLAMLFDFPRALKTILGGNLWKINEPWWDACCRCNTGFTDLQSLCLWKTYSRHWDISSRATYSLLPPMLRSVG